MLIKLFSFDFLDQEDGVGQHDDAGDDGQRSAGQSGVLMRAGDLQRGHCFNYVNELFALLMNSPCSHNLE